MIEPVVLYEHLYNNGVRFFTGVPDSLLKGLSAHFDDQRVQHVITANEGLAIALASGYHLKTGELPLVYLQNSGLGNTINPLTSLADPEVYSIPMILLIGWRGMPGTKDEPQHIKMGKVTTAMLDALDIPYYVINDNEQSAIESISSAILRSSNEKRPVAILISPGVLNEMTSQQEVATGTRRSDVISAIIDVTDPGDIIICTTGKTGREFYEANLKSETPHKKYFLSIGAMGHASHIGLGISMSGNDRVIVLDGDGALLMHMGSLPTIAHYAKDFVHIVLNNGSHESVGGQPTEGMSANLSAIAKASGYPETITIDDMDTLQKWFKDGFQKKGLQFAEILIGSGSHPDLGRPGGKPVDWKEVLMKELKSH